MNKPTDVRAPLNLYDLLFCIGLALLLTHEMDAMTHAEWRILPLTSWLQDSTGKFYFVLAHIPVFALLLWTVSSTGAKIRWWAQVAVDGFLIIHSGLHTLFSNNDAYGFTGPLSLLLIYGAAAFGLLHLWLLLRMRSRSTA